VINIDFFEIFFVLTDETFTLNSLISEIDVLLCIIISPGKTSKMHEPLFILAV